MDLLRHLPQLHSLLNPQALILIPALILFFSAAAAVILRNLFHCALSLTLSFIALGVLFIALGAEFIGLVQILVYVGAVAILIVFAIFLTRPEQVDTSASPFKGMGAIAGALVAYAVLVALFACIFFSPRARIAAPLTEPPTASIAAIGENLLGDYLLPLQATGLLLTVALIGAALLAKEESRS